MFETICEAGFILQDPFSAYRSSLVNTFSSLEADGLCSQLYEIFKRIILLAPAPVLLPFLGLIALLGYVVTSLVAVISLPDWQSVVVRRIRASRQEDPHLELQRLRDNGILTLEKEMRLDAAIEGAVIESSVRVPRGTAKLYTKVLLTQAMEFQPVFPDHLMVPHAQSSKWIVYTHLVKECFRKCNPDVNVHHFKFLRSPLEFTPEEQGDFLSGKWFKQKLSRMFGYGPEQVFDDVRDYLKSKAFVWDENPKTQLALLSGCIYPYANNWKESHIYFMLNNENIFKEPDFIRKCVKRTIHSFFPDLSKQQVREFATQILEIRQPEQPCGNLLAHFIPKEDAERMLRRTHGYARPCECHPEEENMQIFEKLHRGQLDHSTRCGYSAFSAPHIPAQVRIYNPLMQPDTNVKIFLVTSQEKIARKAHKAAIRNIVHAIDLAAQARRPHQQSA